MSAAACIHCDHPAARTLQGAAYCQPCAAKVFLANGWHRLMRKLQAQHIRCPEVITRARISHQRAFYGEIVIANHEHA